MIAPLLLVVAALFQASRDPFAPLTPGEVRRARALLVREGIDAEKTRFSWVSLHEPDKSDVLAGEPIARALDVTTFIPGLGSATEWTLDIQAGKVLGKREIAGVQPRLTSEEFDGAWNVAVADSGWRAALRKRGITDPRGVGVNVWGVGDVPGELGKKRLARLVPYRYADDGNYLARPIEGLTALVDLAAGKILSIQDTGAAPIPPPDPYVLPASEGRTTRADASPEIRTENGERAWKRWRFRWELHPRDGLILRQVSFDGRPILYRAALSEMAVPYGDPSPGWRWRNAIDAGEYGIGQNTASLTRGADVPEGALLFDSTLATDFGEVKDVLRAVALYEQDGGLALKHEAVARRTRQLVLTHTATVGNYDYVFRWVFSEDGTLTNETQLTGIMLAKGGAPHALGDAATAHPVSTSVSAVNHQHFFCWRLDMDVDGAQNRLVECNTSPLPPGPENPEGNAVAMRETILRTESEAKRRLDMAQSRYWKVVSDNGTAYALLPGASALPLAAPTASIRKRAGFLDAHLWATPNAPGELYAAGDYPNQSVGGEGLTRWTKADRPLVNTDLVLWYVVGVTHLPRPEEWPIMNVHKASFQLVPLGFFPRNPLLEK